MKALTIILALLVCSAGTADVQKAKKPVIHTITIDATSFSPASLTVKAGDSVVWVNKDIIPHTATSQKKGVFDSGALAAGKSWRATLKTKGEHAYICLFHPTMKGTLRVE